MSSKSRLKNPSVQYRYKQKADSRALPLNRRRAQNSKAAVLERLGRSMILDVLGPEWFAEVPSVNVPGKVIWCNFELARKLGFDAPLSNQMTPEFHRQLIETLSYRALRKGESIDGRATLTLYADKYGGIGVAPALGAGRAGFLPYGNFCIKGIGLTPLFRSDDPDDFSHSHGGTTLKESLSEAIFGEVNTQLLGDESARVLAIIDHGEHVVSPKKRKEPVVLLIRASGHLRPAHLLAAVRRKAAKFDMFVRMTQATRQLVTRNAGAANASVIDIRATFLRVIDDQAQTAAELFRWRMIHSALSASNMEISGAMLDVCMQSSQPRTAPIWVISDIDSIFGEEHATRAALLRPVYRALVDSIPVRLRSKLTAVPINLRREMERRYKARLRIQLVCSVGITGELAERVSVAHADAVNRFVEVALEMMKLKNPGSVNAGSHVREQVSVLDVFSALRILPQVYFDNPNGSHARQITAAMAPIHRGNRFHLAARKTRVRALVREFDRSYCDLMKACESYAAEFYDDVSAMRRSVIARARFENEATDLLYYAELSKRLDDAIANYRAKGDGSILSRCIEEKIRPCVRNFEVLLTQGRCRRLEGGGFEVQMRTYDGIEYSMKAWDDAAQTRRLCVRVPIEEGTNSSATGLSAADLKSSRYRFTTDGWATCDEVSPRRFRDQRARLVFEFDEIAKLPAAGQLEGVFVVGLPNGMGERTSEVFKGYAFAVPNRRELLKIVARLE